MATPVLETRDLCIRFGGHLAVDRVSAAFQAGTLTAIVGPNGAGKTTYFNLISGQLPASAGRVLLAGRDITPLKAPARARLGLGRAFQLTNLFPRLSVHENVRLAVQAKDGGGGKTKKAWEDFSKATSTASIAFSKAAASKNAATIKTASEKVYSTCVNCHNKFK